VGNDESKKSGPREKGKVQHGKPKRRRGRQEGGVAFAETLAANLPKKKKTGITVPLPRGETATVKKKEKKREICILYDATAYRRPVWCGACHCLVEPEGEKPGRHGGKNREMLGRMTKQCSKHCKQTQSVGRG